jgi:hypothetical protein
MASKTFTMRDGQLITVSYNKKFNGLTTVGVNGGIIVVVSDITIERANGLLDLIEGVGFGDLAGIIARAKQLLELVPTQPARARQQQPALQQHPARHQHPALARQQHPAPQQQPALAPQQQHPARHQQPARHQHPARHQQPALAPQQQLPARQQQPALAPQQQQQPALARQQQPVLDLSKCINCYAVLTATGCKHQCTNCLTSHLGCTICEDEWLARQRQQQLARHQQQQLARHQQQQLALAPQQQLPARHQQLALAPQQQLPARHQQPALAPQQPARHQQPALAPQQQLPARHQQPALAPQQQLPARQMQQQLPARHQQPAPQQQQLARHLQQHAPQQQSALAPQQQLPARHQQPALQQHPACAITLDAIHGDFTIGLATLLCPACGSVSKTYWGVNGSNKRQLASGPGAWVCHTFACDCDRNSTTMTAYQAWRLEETIRINPKVLGIEEDSDNAEMVRMFLQKSEGLYNVPYAAGDQFPHHLSIDAQREISIKLCNFKAILDDANPRTVVNDEVQ